MARRLGIIAALLAILPACLSGTAAGAISARLARAAAHRAVHFHRARRHRRRHRTRPRVVQSGSRPAQSQTAVVSDCAGVDLQPSPADVQLVREAVLCLVDRERASHGEQALTGDADLQRAAEGHTRSMATKGYFDHDGPGGDTPLSRIQASGYLAGDRFGYDIGENIAWGSGYLGTPRSIVAAWMASPEHRENILDPHFRDTGVGVAMWTPGGTGGLYTQDFGTVYR